MILRPQFGVLLIGKLCDYCGSRAGYVISFYLIL